MSIARDPWWRLSFIFLLALIARVALADGVEVAENKGRRPNRATPQQTLPATPTEPVSDTSRKISNFPLDVSVGTGLGFMSGSTAFLLNAGITTEVSPELPLWVGFDTGFNFWGSTLSTSTTGIQLLPTAVYKIALPSTDRIRPFAGLSMGPNILVSSTSLSSGGLTINSSSSTRVVFEILFRPGVEFDLSHLIALTFEPKFGILDGHFIFAPQAACVFRL